MSHPSTPLTVRPDSRTIATGAHPLHLRGGRTLAPVELEFATWGRPDPERSNAILVCHSFSADAHAAGSDGTASADWRPWRVGRRGWWDELIGPGRAIDTDRWWVVCSNVLGGSGGSTGPTATDPATGLPWHDSFPALHLADVVAAQQHLMDQLAIPRWRLVVGGSLGGLQALTWAITGGHRVDHVVAIAAAAALSPGGRAYFRQGAALVAEDLAQGGDGLRGMHAAMGRGHVFSGGPAAHPLPEGYDWQTEWPAERLHPRTFLALSQALLDFDLARDWGDGDLVAAARRIRADVDLLGYRDDHVFTPTAQVRLAKALRRAGVRTRHALLHGDHGHDSFLEEPAALDPWLRGLLDAVPTRLPADRTSIFH